MAMNDRIRSIGAAASAATAAAPYVRRMMADQKLRESFGDVLRSSDRLYDHVSDDGGLSRIATDDKVRRDIDGIIGSLQETARRVRRDARRRRVGRTALIIGAGLSALAAGMIAAALVYPRTRSGIVQVASDTREKVVGTIGGAREKVSGAVSGTRVKVSETADEVRRAA